MPEQAEIYVHTTCLWLAVSLKGPGEAAGAGNSFTHSILIDSSVFVISLRAACLLFQLVPKAELVPLTTAKKQAKSTNQLQVQNKVYTAAWITFEIQSALNFKITDQWSQFNLQTQWNDTLFTQLHIKVGFDSESFCLIFTSCIYCPKIPLWKS